MFCKGDKCSKCKFHIKMYVPNKEDPEKPTEEWNCVHVWNNVVLSEISQKLTYLIKKGEKNEEV